MDEFRKDISRVQADNERLNERVSALETAEVGKASGARKQADGADRPKLQVVKLGPGDEEIVDDPAAEAMAEADQSASDQEPVVIRAEGSRTSTSKPKDAGAAGRDYDGALALVKRKQYDKALEAFAGFLVRHPDDANADNAMYWRGECFFAKGEFARAAEEFSGLIARFPQGNKVPDAMLKLAMAQIKLGDRAKANETFSQLRKQYPSSDATRKIPRE